MTNEGVKRGAFIALCLFGALLFSGLGGWQVQRLGWKLDLIARVNARVSAPPSALPLPQDWPSFHAQANEYRHVHVTGTWVEGRDTLVDALTEIGPGSWVITPLRIQGGVVMINRGFIPTEQRGSRAWADLDPSEPVNVTGLLRVTEPTGRFLRPNKPARNAWYSRDVNAIGHARGFSSVAPFFIDADASVHSPGAPVGGLTVVRFRNAHLFYAVTWFGLALLCVGGLVLLVRQPQKED